MLSWKQNFFVIFSMSCLLSQCGDVGVIPNLKNKEELKIKDTLVVDPSAFTIVSATSKEEIKVKVDLAKVGEASTLVFSTRNSCLNGESRDIEENLSFTVPKDMYNTTFTLYIQLKKDISLTSGCVEIKTITHDDIVPQSVSLNINSGDSVTPNTQVTLGLSAEGASQMYITNKATCKEDGEWSVYKTTKDWTLGQTNTLATVYAKFRDEAGNESDCVSKSITHDNTAPTEGSINFLTRSNHEAITIVTTSDVAILLEAKDASAVYVTNAAGCTEGGDWTELSVEGSDLAQTVKDWTLVPVSASATVYAKFKDEADNESACISKNIAYDTESPTNPSLVINNNAAFTSSSSVSLALTAIGASEVYLTNTEGCTSGGSWTSFTSPATQNWTLGQTNALATVYAKFRDEAGNESICINATITHDNVTPTGASLLIESGANFITSSTVSLTLTAIGASEVYVTNTANCSTGGSWASFTSPATQNNWVLDQINAVATVYAKFRDAAGNESSCINDTILHGTSGSVDYTFGTDGIKKFNFATNSVDTVGATALQQHNGVTKILVVGSTKNAPADRTDFAIARLMPDGSFDSSFGSSGVKKIDIQGYDDSATSILVTSSGILVAGSAGSTVRGNEFVIVRLSLENGELDSSFVGPSGGIYDGIGVVMYDLQTTMDSGNTAVSDVVNAIAVDSANNIYLGGYTATNSNDFAILKLSDSGSKVDAFGLNGIKTYDIDTKVDTINAMLVTSSGLLVAGSSGTTNKSLDFTIALLSKNDGSLDTSFGSGTGKKIFNVDNAIIDDVVTAMAVTSDSIFMGGYSGQSAGVMKFSAISMDLSGNLRNSFGTNGIVTVGVSTSNFDKSYAMVLQPDGKIILAGFAYTGANIDYGVVRLRTDGTLDTSFATGGKKIVNLGASSEVRGINLQSDGRIVLVGMGGAQVSIVRLFP